MGLRLHILGCHSATPKANAQPSAQLLELDGHMYLIDCGEGTQVALRENKIKFARIKQIFISHLHGDHYFGLFGLIATFNLLGRREPLHIFGPKGIKEIVLMSLKLGDSWTKFSLCFHELDQKESVLIFEDQVVTVRTLPLDHRVYTNGFLFTQKPRLRTLNAEAARGFKVSSAYFNKAKQGQWVQDESGHPLDYRAITTDPPEPISYAYCSDTAFYPPLADLIQGVTLLYHESTFLSQHEHLCVNTKHSSALQAAEMALLANAKFLLLGHYSGRYRDLAGFKSEASAVFFRTYLARENAVFTLEHGGQMELTQI